MKSAIYGRMKIGRCIKQEPETSEATMNDERFLGCSKDILNLADWRCSGRYECDIRPADLELETTNCYSYLKLYLEASYECIKGRNKQHYYRIIIKLFLMMILYVVIGSSTCFIQNKQCATS